jgi:hypothetical protein
MAARDRIAFPIGINTYVPAMAYASDLVHGQPTAFSLGSPAAVSANNIAAAIAANAVATTAVALAYTSDSKYGRTLRLTPSGDPGNAVAIDIFGFDYLGQPMVERFTGASGSTAILYGRKAFGRVTQSKVVTAATNAVTWAVGTGLRMGLPYKGDVAWAMESGVQQQLFKRDFNVMKDVDAADAVAGISQWIESPCPGFIKALNAIPWGGGGGTNNVVTAKLATVAVTGLTVTPVNATGGVKVTGAPTTAGYSANNRLVKGTIIEVPIAAAAAGKGVSVGVDITPTQVSLPDLTDPQTNITGDPRGTYEPMTTPAGFEIIVGLVGDSQVNTSGNGGLHGLRHSST